jgi:hypothetical protein
MREARVVGRLANQDLFVRGTVITLKRKCGTPTCRCARHEPHATPALSYSVGGSTKMLTFRPADLPMIRAALARYRKAQAELDKRALRGIAALRDEFTQQRASRRGVSR